MKSDLKIPVVKGVEVVALKRNDDEQLWDIVVINRNSYPLENVLIASKGYGDIDGEKQETSILRHRIENLPPNSYAKIEPIQKEVFHLTNEYWVSYFFNSQMYDRKYLFPSDSIQSEKALKIHGFDFIGIVSE